LVCSAGRPLFWTLLAPSDVPPGTGLGGAETVLGTETTFVRAEAEPAPGGTPAGSFAAILPRSDSATCSSASQQRSMFPLKFEIIVIMHHYRIK